MIRVSAENMIKFITVSGFFIGLIFCIINTYDPIDMLVYTLEITLFFYLLAHIATMSFTDVNSVKSGVFHKKSFEDISSYFVHEIEERESRIDALMKVGQNVSKGSKPRKKKKIHDGSYEEEKKAA